MVRRSVAAVALGLLIALFVLLGPSRGRTKLVPDFIQFWTAAELLSSGHSPYDPMLQRDVQQRLGWNTQTDGLGLYEFLPYYYPPWLGLACTVLLPLGYRYAQLAWLALGAAALVGAALLLKNAARAVPPGAVALLVVLFAPCVVSVLMGQVSVLVLLSIVLAWTLMRHERDTVAGVVLAWLTIKPQLTVVLLLGLLAWCIRRRRWRVIVGFGMAFAVLAAASTLLVPHWPTEMVAATKVTPLPTDLFPYTGASFANVLLVLGIRDAAWWACYVTAAVVGLAIAGRLALDRTTRLERLMGVCLIAPFFVAPYARHYDFPILLVPAIVLMSETKRPAGAVIFVALIVLPYVHLALLARLAAAIGIAPFPGPQVTLFWIPSVVALAWALVARHKAISDAAPVLG